tara:strand:+ start:24703 stop:29169 length:4467 start_codon:yes stop_codon:yes gene_type:complete
MKALFKILFICCFSTVAFAQTIIHTADFETGLDGWTQDLGDNFDWTRDAGGTPSTNTGPSTGASGSYYMYTEASSNYGKIANFDSPSFNLSGTVNPKFIFYYHMYGSDMGTLYVDISTDGGATYPTNLWTNTGQVQGANGSAWIPVSINLSAYIGLTVKIGISGLTGSSYNSDMAIDNILVIDKPNPTIGPGGITTDLQLWLKANDGLHIDGNGVNTWKDQAIGADATTNLAAQAPTYRDNSTYNVNFNPVVDFDNSYNPVSLDGDYSFDDTSTQFLEGTSGLYTQDMFVVIIPDVTVDPSFGSMDVFCGDEFNTTNQTDATGIGVGAYTARFSGEILCYSVGTTSSGDGYGVAEIGTGNTYSNVGILNARNNSSVTEQELYYNANNVGTNQNDVPDFSNVNNSRYWIGRSEGWKASTDARIAEIITFSSRQDDTTERARIQSYLAIKYGITLGVNGISQDYVDSFGNTIWDVSANAGFNYDIAGIGKDDDSELNQKQSKSVNPGSVVAIGLGEVASTNNTNANSFATDLDFLVWGNDNNAFNTTSEVAQNINLSGSTTTFTPVSRKWKILETQNDVAEVVISIVTSNLTSNIPLAANEEYTLVVADNSSFANTTIIDVVPLTTNGANSEVWYDFDGTKYFTIAKATRVEEKRSIDFTTNEFLLGDASLELNTNFTVSGWVKNNVNGGSFISKGTGYNFKINGSKNIEIDWNGSTKITSTNTIDSNWHHIALTFSGGTATLYIDGILDKTVNSLANPTSSTYKFSIGALYTNKTTINSFDGAVDEVRFWNSALTITEIRYIMNQEIEEFSTNVDGEILPQNITKNDISARSWNNLQAYYDMNSFYGTTVEDNSNNKNWARIKYLTKDKQVVETQTAPLPYESSTNGNWDTAATWLNNAVQYLPNTTLNGVQVDWNIVETNTNVNTTRGVTVLGLKNNTNELSINTANSLTISHYLLLNGVIDLDGESQLIQTIGSDLDVLSAGYLERDQQGEGNKYRYNDWSSPVIAQGTGNTSSTPFSIANVLRDGTNASSPGAIVYNNTGYDGATSPMTLSTYWMYKYANLTGLYSEWQQIRSTGNLYAGEGFLMKGTGNPGASDQNYVFEGKPNNGTINLTVSANNDYLVGNPYPSAIDANQFIVDNASSITGTLYFWEHWGNDSHILAEYQAGYGTYNLSGGLVGASAIPHVDVAQTGSGTKTPERYIAVSQGFFVVGDASGGTIEFNNGQRTFVTEASTNSIFMKAEKNKRGPIKHGNNTTKKDRRPKIRIGFDAPQIDHRQLLLTIDKKTTDKLDWGYDGEMYQIFNDDMYWMVDDKKLAIQATNKIRKHKEIPLGIVTVEGGTINIKIDTLENVNTRVKFYIKDNETGRIHSINKKSFSIQLEAGEYHNRFSLVFNPGKRIKPIKPHRKGELNTNFLIYMNNDTSEVEIQKPMEEVIENINLYNYLGQLLNSWNQNLQQEIINLPVNQSSGVYILQIISQNGNTSKKIIIN